MSKYYDNIQFMAAVKDFWAAAREVTAQGRDIMLDEHAMHLAITALSVGSSVGMSAEEACAALLREEPGRLPEDFRAAMREYVMLCEESGGGHPDSKRALTMALHLAPRWFVDDVMKDGDLPAPRYTEDGAAVFSSQDLADHLGVSHGEVCAAVEEYEEITGEVIPCSSAPLHRMQ
jgi:hypothetical protein